MLDYELQYMFDYMYNLPTSVKGGGGGQLQYMFDYMYNLPTSVKGGGGGTGTRRRFTITTRRRV